MRSKFRMALPLMFIAPSFGYAEVGKFTCSFPNLHSFDEVRMLKSESFVLKFTFDTATGDAFLEGNVGITPVMLVKGDRGLTFLEHLLSGGVQTTTIALDGKAVHSRHTIIGSQLAPSQYYGSCD
ncbi:MAG TPA: hypothetical protein ENH63_03630 [Sulfitobacter litoralis]|uniref:Uncharacterized protein n=1 Tax=Sulfitobacter litoralis TaxID=335975 RepID=A0A7V1A5W5_9RHOB|nr:hypothetical protein [Sulfitobacter litoralis]HDY95199.1 hypothetical protein [Sulfitobacter litoralis]HDZ50873.1 hypothetical protein [Sulfitobacter litoralis]